MSDCTISFQGEGDFPPAQVETGKTLFEGLPKEKSAIRYGCESGVCGTCLVHVIEGMENLTPIDEVEQETLEELANDERARLACRFKVNGPVKLEYIGFSG